MPQAARADDDALLRALGEIHASDPSLAAARARVDQAVQGISVARQQARPSASVSTGIAVNQARQTKPNEETLSTNPRNITLRASQPVPIGGRLRAAGERARASADAAVAAYRVAEQEVLLAGVAAYMALWRDRELLELARADEALAEDERAIVRRRVELGEATRTDSALADARAAETQADRLAARQNLTRSETGLRRLLGRVPRVLEPPEAPPALEGSRPELEQRARSGHPALHQAQFQLDAAAAGLREIRKGLNPQVQITGTYTLSAEQNGEGQAARNLNLGLGVEFPFLVAGQLTDEHRIRIAQREALGHERTNAERRIDEAVGLAWSGREIAAARIAALELSVASADQALKAVREENRLGVRGLAEVIQVQRDLLRARNQLIGARHDWVVAGYRLMASVGGLEPQALGLPRAPAPVVPPAREIGRNWPDYGILSLPGGARAENNGQGEP